MHTIRVSGSKDYFVCGEKPFFYLADTVWTAFTSVKEEEWEEYLDLRSRQNFNAIQLSTLPLLHDTSGTELAYCPFGLKSDGVFDFYKINEDYFLRGAKMLESMRRKGFVPVIVPLWGNYIPGSWASEKAPGNQMPLDAVDGFIEYMVKLFDEYKPMYLLGGDVKFEDGLAEAYYCRIMKKIRRIAPGALISMHTSMGISELPEVFEKEDGIDFYMYQSGHMIEAQDLNYAPAREFYGKNIKKPVLNGEPCYEGSGHGYRYGRFTAFDVRKAMWQSILSGAKAGFAYGAHGVWCWHERGDAFNGAGFSGMPYDRRNAMHFKGAWDVSFGRKLYEVYSMFDLEPLQLPENTSADIKMAASKDMGKIVLYAPYSVDVTVGIPLNDYECTAVDLDSRYFFKPGVECANHKTIIRMSESNSDTLLILQRVD